LCAEQQRTHTDALLGCGGQSSAHAVMLQGAWLGGGHGGPGGGGGGAGGRIGGVSWHRAARTDDARDSGVTVKLRRPSIKLPATVVNRGAETVKLTFQLHGHAGRRSTESASSSTRWISMYWSALENTAKWSALGS
jgi:hypothetical protein